MATALNEFMKLQRWWPAEQELLKTGRWWYVDPNVVDRRYRELNPYGTWGGNTFGRAIEELSRVKVIHHKDVGLYLNHFYFPWTALGDWSWQAPPIFHSSYTRYYAIRDLVRILPPRPRCGWCGKRYQYWDPQIKADIWLQWRDYNAAARQVGRWRFPAGQTCGAKCEQLFQTEARREERRTVRRWRRREREQQWLREGKALLRAVRVMCRPHASRLPSAVSAPRATSEIS